MQPWMAKMAKTGKTLAICVLCGCMKWIYDGDGGACRRCAKER